MRHLLVGATLLLLALAATFGVASVLQSRAIALREAPVAGDPDRLGKPTGDQGRSGFHRVNFEPAPAK
jgi:hypothetical protein